MAALTGSEIEKLFSGAPQYFARSEGHFTGAPHPSVAFPWDETLEIRDLTDHLQIEDQAWRGVTAWPHIIRGVHADADGTPERHRAHFYPKCRERPNMLSMAGLEKGSVGYQAALELAVGDSLRSDLSGFRSLVCTDPSVLAQRREMVASKDALRRLDEPAILEQLIKTGQRYSQPHANDHRVVSELYNELFLKVLHPPTKVFDHRDPYSLSVQIRALVKVLATPNVWIDFSHVEWRLRLGQLLWGQAPYELGASAEAIREERRWLLLQVLLSCELLIRLDAITEGDELGVECINPSVVYRFEKDARQPVRWSMHLARAWLENIDVVRRELRENGEQAHAKPSGWLATLTRHIPLSHEYEARHQQQVPVYAISGKHCGRQIDGLAHFATRLRWPGDASYLEKVLENCKAAMDGAPLDMPSSRPDSRQAHSYLKGLGETGPETEPEKRRRPDLLLRPCNWLSKSYISGLILPGDSLCHLLMSTLLENDPEAIAKLGNVASLPGGFIYQGKSFWSTACIVGRVLAAGKGSAECMGWISSDVTPLGHAEGWVSVEAHGELSDNVQGINKNARLWAKASVERESRVLGDADPSSVIPTDFIIPFENIHRERPPFMSIELQSLRVGRPVSAARASSVNGKEASVPPDVATLATADAHSAAVSFKVSKEGEDKEEEHTFGLSQDVFFVTAHPCVPSQHAKIIKSPSSPTIENVDLSGNGVLGKAASTIGHPLHKHYTYTSIHLSELLARRELSLESLLSEYSTAARCAKSVPSGSTARVLIIDCITGFRASPQEHEIPLSPAVSNSQRRSSFTSSTGSSPNSHASGGDQNRPGAGGAGVRKMHQETRRRHFGSDMEILVRAICAEKGWNAIISRRRRGCLACAIREAGALAWKVVIRVD